jgi:hypothetical protein
MKENLGFGIFHNYGLFHLFYIIKKNATKEVTANSLALFGAMLSISTGWSSY